MSWNGVGVVGTYEGIVVRENSVSHFGNNNVPIEWINPYTFYFKWSDGNEQIWVYDTTGICLYQICNKIDLDIFTRHRCKRLSGVEDIVNMARNLGNYEGITIYESSVNHCGKTVPITWINPHAFYFYYDATNLQIWIYDPEIEAYLQVGTTDGDVRRAHGRVELIHRPI